MAIVFKFRYASTNVHLQATGDVTTIQWIPNTSQAGEDVEESIAIFINDTSDDALATEIQTFDDLILRVNRYRENPSYATPVWFHAKRGGETGERRALVKRLGYTLTSGGFTPDARQFKQKMQLTLLRAGYWERTTTRSLPNTTNLSGAAITYDPTSSYDPLGDVAGRINFWAVTNTSGAGKSLDRFWFGIRSLAVHYDLADFEPIWELEDGTNEGISADDAASEVDTSSPGGGAGVFVNIDAAANDTWEKAMSIKLSDMTTMAKYDSNLGTFLWLLRGKVSTGTYYVRLAFGFSGMPSTDMVYTNPIEITATDWDYYEMGVYAIGGSIPNTNIGFAPLLGSFEIEVWVMRTAGAGDLKADCLVPLPVDEGYFIASDVNIGNTEKLYGLNGAKDIWLVLGYDGTSFNTAAIADINSFALPPGDARIYGVFARAAKCVLDDEITIASSTFYERWRSLRGSE